MHIVCFKHVPFEGPAAIADWAQSRGHSIECIEVYAEDPLPDANRYEMLIVMGGPMNIYQEGLYPWLAVEKQAIRKAIDGGKIVVGVCLGGQLIADVLGGSVTRGDTVEIGWLPIERSRDCPSELPLPDSLHVYHWHGDTFALPDNAVRIASTKGCANQGFLYNKRVLGLQCHLETTRESMNALIEACEEESSEGPFIQSAEMMRAEPDETFEKMQAVLFEILDQISSHG
ncbi:MAG: type 1 glutamine amidotransferase [Verrucomicrobiota bacterium]